MQLKGKQVRNRSIFPDKLKNLPWKEVVVAASTGNLDLSSMPATVDGVALNAGDRFLAKDQSTLPQNGIYVFAGAGSAATRATDANTTDELNRAIVSVVSGTMNTRTTWEQFTANPTVGASDIVWDTLGLVLAHLHPYLVGPVGLAPYQTIQAAINQAVTDGHDSDDPADVFILPGTYTEDLAIKPGVSLRAAVLYVSRSGSDPVSTTYAAYTIEIIGNHTYDHIDAGTTSHTIQIQGLRFLDDDAGALFAFVNSARKRIYFIECSIRNYNGVVLDFGTSGNCIMLFAKSYVYTASGYMIADIPGPHRVFGESTQFFRSGFGDLVDVHDGGWFTAVGYYTDGLSTGGALYGKVRVSGGTGNFLTLTGQLFTTSMSAPHVIVDGQLATYKLFQDCYIADGQPITITGTFASEFKEVPFGVDGDIRRSKDGRWINIANNYVATVDPTVNDDETAGYADGSYWLNTTTPEIWICVDPTTGAAVWKKSIDKAILSNSNRWMTASVTSSDEDEACSTAMAASPEGAVELLVNGAKVPVGDGAKDQFCFFSSDGGTTPKALAAIASGDKAYWMGSIANYELDENDRVDFLYEV